ncbi:TonB-dependent receptor domain-containing protein [Ferruginibacter yonginensis]|uniref:TonB-dependent receptor domain-containing protein n=1 Tax=Ferruginibacter yonginensis TaxID=1310416 RepID=A0ABV8QR76_9BACT
MKSRLLTSCILVLLSNAIYAQNIEAKVVIKNEQQEAITNATVQFLRTADSAIVAVRTLKNNVSFSIKKNTTYFLRISAVNINNIFTQVSSGDNDTTFTVNAQTKTKDMGAVVVNAVKPIIKQDDDKTVVDVEPIAVSSTNAFEVLEKTPGAIVDQDGNVYLNSTTPATVFINGREIKLSASDLSSLLKSLPANSISKVEILRTPSAKYDAASSGGIVNIVLKKGVKLGTNGSFDVSHFQGKVATQSIGFNINKSADKLNLRAAYSFTNRNNYDVLTSSRISNSNTIFNQDAYTKLPGINNYANVGVDYNFNKKWSAGYDVRLSANNNHSRVNNDIDIKSISTNTTIGKNVSIVQNNGPSIYLGNNFTTKLKIDSLGSEWTNNIDYTYFKTTNNQVYQNLYIQPSKNTMFGNGDVNNTKNIITYRTDLVLKLKNKYTVELGTKANVSFSKNNAAYFADTSMGKYVDRFQTNRFKYKETIAASYFQVAKTFKGLTVKPGLRLEYTNINGNQLIPSDTTFKINRTDLFPFLFLRHKIAKVFGFKLSASAIYKRSITRPFYEALNPFPRYADQYTFDVGNPSLQPQFTTNYEVNIMADDFPLLTAGFNNVKNIFSNITYVKNDTLFRTYDNLGTNKEAYLRLVAGIPPGKKYFFYAGAQANFINYNGLYDNAPFTFKRTSWNLFMFQSFKATPTLNLSLNGFMRINAVANFFELKNFGSLNFSANKSLLNKKMNIVLSVNDMFRTNRNAFTVDQTNFTATGLRYTDTRRVGIAVKYNFGIKPKAEPKQTIQVPNEFN